MPMMARYIGGILMQLEPRLSAWDDDAFEVWVMSMI